MKKTRQPPTLRRTLTRWLVLPVLTLWFLSMALLTWAVAKDMYHQLEDGVQDWCDYAMRIETYVEEDSLPGTLEKQMFWYTTYMNHYFLNLDTLLPIVLPQNDGSHGSGDLSWKNWELELGYQSAAAFYRDGVPVLFSGDVLLFSYRYNAWETPVGYGYIDLEALPGGEDFADKYIDTSYRGASFPFHAISVIGGSMKMTGWFEGNQFIPVEIYAGTKQLYSGAQADRELVTILLDYEDMDGYNYEPGKPFYLNGKRYKNAAALLEEDVNSRFDLFSAVIVSPEYATGSSVGVKMVVWCSPLEYAMCRLWPVYLVSFLLAAVCVHFLLRCTWRKLTDPLDVMNRDLEHNRIPFTQLPPRSLREIRELHDRMDAAQQERQQAINQVQQLEKALSYAQNAEENRRKMVSAIAHELKTPLAVIHSYAEGLQAGIAAEKQDKYLSVILEETETMDAMVLEMLDLSRLEAGKVQLSTDQFSLTALTQGILEKLSPAAEAKQLQIEYSAAQELFVTADEARMGQVITNLATNAVKYTPQGGTIRVRLFHSAGLAHFCIENTSPPLSQEALDQVWDTFYRADTARAGSGTGLGLAIVKNIVELHRGTCSARNTKRGVEFRFQIPM